LGRRVEESLLLHPLRIVCPLVREAACMPGLRGRGLWRQVSARGMPGSRRLWKLLVRACVVLLHRRGQLLRERVSLKLLAAERWRRLVGDKTVAWGRHLLLAALAGEARLLDRK